jgi:hypothetical protein
MAEELVLDTAIRDWVLIPLSVVMVLIGVLRYFVSKLMRSPPSASPSPDPKAVKEGCVRPLPPALSPQSRPDLVPDSLDPTDLDRGTTPGNFALSIVLIMRSISCG